MQDAGRSLARRRRRAVVLSLVAVALGLLAASRVRDTVEEIESRTGAPVRVLVALRGLPEGAKLDRRRVAHAIAVREVPSRYAPRDAIESPEYLIGLETAVSLRPGAYVTASMLRDPSARQALRPAVRPGQRLVEVAVTGGAELAAQGTARVDVLVTTETSNGRGRTFVALENVELIAARPARAGEHSDADGTAPDTVATLRVGARAAVFLTAAQNFAREVRLLARPVGDRGRVGRAEVGGRGL